MSVNARAPLRGSARPIQSARYPGVCDRFPMFPNSDLRRLAKARTRDWPAARKFAERSEKVRSLREQRRDAFTRRDRSRVRVRASLLRL